MAIRGIYSKTEKKMLEDWQEDLDKLVGWLGDEDTASATVPYPVFHRTASRDLIRHMAFAADYWNPLYRDDEYAKKTRWGGIIAPPAFQHCIAHGGPIYRLRVPPEYGTASFETKGEMWEFLKPIRVNDSFKVWVGRPQIEDITPPVKDAPRKFKVMGSVSYINQRDEVTGILHRRGYVTILPPGTRKSEGKIKFAEEYVYTKEDIKVIDSLVDAEERRGSRPLYWEDVNIGDEPKPVVKGPITIWDTVVEIQGMGLALLPMIEVRRQTPERIVVDPATNIPHKSIGFHFTDNIAKILGHYSTTLIAPTIEHFFARLITNWIGDDGFLRKLDCYKLNNVPLGDTIYGRGRVIKKYQENGEYLVDLDVWMETIRGFVPYASIVTVSLLSREEIFK